MNIEAELPITENRRVQVIEREMVNSDEEACFDDLVKLASKLCHAPISVITLVYQDKSWFKASVGLSQAVIQGSSTICREAVLRPDILITEDAMQDERFNYQPMMVGDMEIRFYASAPLKSSLGQHLGVLCVMDSMPHVMDAEQVEVLRILAHQVVTQIELRQCQREMQLHNDKLKEINASKDKMFSIIAHDLRAPFHGILGFSEVLETEIETLDEKGIRDIAGYLRSTAQATFRLLENLLQWAMTEGDMMVYRPKEMRINDVFHSVCDILGAVAQKKNITVHCEAPQNIKVLADINMMNSLLQNLMSNALKFTANGGHVYLSAYEVDQQVYISVRDTGVGMTEKQIEKFLSRKPAKSSKGTEGEQGAGLGLILCRQFAEKNNGVISLASELRQGTTFTLMMPALKMAS